MSWQNLDKSHPDSAHYSVMKCVANEMLALREMFPEAKADDLNFVLFSTSGVHGTYTTIEGAEEDGTDVTFLVVHPRLVSLRYGNVQPKTPDDWDFLKRLRQSSWDVARQIGATTPPQQEQAAPGAVPDEAHRITSWGHCLICGHDKIPGEGCARTDCPDASDKMAEIKRLSQQLRMEARIPSPLSTAPKQEPGA